MQDAQQTTPKAALPDWVTETPDLDNWTPYVLVARNGIGTHEQTVDMTEAEFDAVKRHLARLRGYEVPEPEGEDDDEPETGGETAPAKTAAPTNAAAVESTYGRLISRAVDDITERLRRHARTVTSPPVDQGADTTQLLRSEFQADMLLLQRIIEDWDGQGHDEEYPGETRLVAAIRGNL